MNETLPVVAQNGASLPAPTIPEDAARAMEQVVMKGDLSQLNAGERLAYYRQVCDSLGLNPLTRPFDYIVLNSKLTLYAKRDAADQLRRRNGITLGKPEITFESGLVMVTIEARDKSGRIDYEVGAVTIDNLKGEARANAIMKAITKAKRRVTLSLCGLGWLDETEVAEVPGAQRVRVDFETGEVTHEAAAPSQSQAPAPSDPSPVSEATMRNLHRIGREVGLSPDDLHELAMWEFNVASKKDLTEGDAKWWSEALPQRAPILQEINDIIAERDMGWRAVLRAAKKEALADLSTDMLGKLRDHLASLPVPTAAEPGAPDESAAEPSGAASGAVSGASVGEVRNSLMAKLAFTAEARGLKERDVINLIGERYGRETYTELTDGQIADLESHIRGNYTVGVHPGE